MARTSDAVLEGMVELAREAVIDVARAQEVGDHIGTLLEDTRLLTHYFQSLNPGYKGWRWAVTLSRYPRSRKATVSEVALLPAEGALLAPAWVPWAERLSPTERQLDNSLHYVRDIEQPKKVDTNINSGAESVPEYCRAASYRLYTLMLQRRYAFNRGYARETVHMKNISPPVKSIAKVFGPIRKNIVPLANQNIVLARRAAEAKHPGSTSYKDDSSLAASSWPVTPILLDDSEVEIVTLTATE